MFSQLKPRRFRLIFLAILFTSAFYAWRDFFFPQLRLARQTKPKTDPQYANATGVRLRVERPTVSPSPRADPSPTHTWRPDGRVIVNHDAPHPIFELIKRAEEEWEGKLKRASETLEEAVAEYKRRYKRPPPKGFDDWCVLLLLSSGAKINFVSLLGGNTPS
jgi:hypothetical protein